MKKYTWVISYVLPVLFSLYLSTCYGVNKYTSSVSGFGIADIIYLFFVFFGFCFMSASGARYYREVNMGLVEESKFTKGMYFAGCGVVLFVGVCYLII